MVKLFTDNLITDVMLSRSIVIGSLYALLLLMVGIGLWLLRGNIANRLAISRFDLWLWICIAAYAIWALLGQNIEKPRHIAPIAGPILFVLYIGAIRTASSLYRAQAGKRRSFRVGYMTASYGIGVVMLAIVATQIVHGTHLLQLQDEQKPAIYQMHEYIASLDEPLVVYTWEETRVLQYLQADYEHRRI